MKPIIIPETYNYVGVFLTLSCNLKCSYCLNNISGKAPGRKHLSTADWIEGLNRLQLRGIPISLQGGEPTLKKGYEEIIKKVDAKFDILTNLQFDVETFMMRVDPKKVTRDAPYASIRVSFHPEQMELDPLLGKVQQLKMAGYSVGVWGILHPKWEKEIREAKEVAEQLGIDFRFKEFLGEYEHRGKMYGTLKYPTAITYSNKDPSAPRIDPINPVKCKTTELLIGPDGNIYRCHADLYEMREPIGHILDPEFTIEDKFRDCDKFGCCNPCDIKVTFDRFQQYGHTSVEII